jgi:signal transduction histidine kinase
MMVEERTKELREAQEQLVRREKLAALGQIAGSIGHELRNPLGVIGNSAFYLKTKFKDEDEKVMKHLNILQREIRRSDAIISDLLDFSRVSLPSLEEIDVNSIVKDALANAETPENIALETWLNESLPGIHADPVQIQQVFQNIISNAFQAMPEGGRLEITTGTRHGFVETIFKDTGGGIPDENIQKIFEPLFTTKAKGIGLGLSIVKSIIDRHKGEIEVKSEAGKGTAFTVKLSIESRQDKE